MPSTTYTLLVTIAHDDGAALSTDLMSTIVQRGLEEGVRDMAGVLAASVDAFKGDHLRAGSDSGRLNACAMHRDLREGR